MKLFSPHKRLWVMLAVAMTLTQVAHAHFIWVKVEPSGQPGGATIRAFFNEQPLPDADFLKYVRDVKLSVDGQTVPSALTEESCDAAWVGKAPVMVDVESDLGVMTKKDKSFRLYYTARAQTEPVAADAKESATKLRVRLIKDGEKEQVEVLFDGKAVAKAPIQVYPAEGEPTETAADDRGRGATIAGLAKGDVALWANWVDPTAGEKDGKAFAETRHYATFTYTPAARTTAVGAAESDPTPTEFARMSDPAVNSFGGAVLGKWLYVYSGHVGRTHRYSVETTAKSFRRLDLEDRKTWEDLPMGKDVQGVALVTDGKYLYRLGGMAARNKPGEDQDLHSVADFAQFDPASRTWTDLAPMPEPRSTHDAAVIGRTVYVAGGWTMNGESDESTYPESTLAFDLDRPAEGWKALPQPFRRRGLSAAEHGGKLYVLGGLVGGGMTVERRVDVYDPKAGAWSQGPSLPGKGRTEGFGTSSFAVDGRLYFSGASGQIFRLSDSGDAWEAVGALWLPRITHRLLPGPDHTLLVVGGNSKGKQTPVIESIRLPIATAPVGAAAGE